MCLLFVTSLTSIPAWATAPKTAKQLTVATYTYGQNDRLGNIRPIALQMAKSLGATLNLKSYPTIGELVEALRCGEADVAIMNTFGYLLLQTDAKTSVVPLAALEVPADAMDAYTACLLASKQSGITSPEQLRNNSMAYSIAFAGRHSTSGNLIPRLFLSSLGIAEPEEQFGQVKFLNSHADAMQEVLNGATDIAALGTGEYEKQLESGKLKEHEVVKLWESEAILQGPVVCKASMPARQQKKLLKVLLQAHEENPETIVQLKRAWTEANEARQFVAVSENYYSSLINLAGNKEKLRKILEQHL